MPPRELSFYVFWLAWSIHRIFFVRTFEEKCSKRQRSNKSTYRCKHSGPVGSLGYAITGSGVLGNG